MRKHFAALGALVVFAVLSRLVPHPWNWTAVGAAALLGGARFERLGEALLVPLIALVATDLILGFHSTLAFVYGAVALTAWGAFLFREKIAGWRVGVAAICASLGFYLITNFGVWWSGGLYAPDFGGLIASYVAGLPFLVNQMTGDIFYSAVLFGAWDFVGRRVLASEKV